MINFTFKVSSYVENKKHFIPFMMKLYELSNSINFAVNKIDDKSKEKIEFDIDGYNILDLITLFNSLPDESDLNIPFRGVTEFSLQFEISSYNSSYKQLLHSLIDKEVFQINIEDSFSNMDYNKKVTIQCSWKENLKAIIKKLPKE